VELVNGLKALAARSVPPRSCGRNKTHTEAWSTSTLLASLAETELLKYPLAYEEAADKPDLRLHLPSRSVGVEITEMVPENYAQAIAIANAEFDDSLLVEPSLFPWGAPKLSGAQIRAMLSRMQTELTGPPSGGDGGRAVALEWATAVRDTLLTKLEKINAPGYMAFADYWLVIYDNLPLSGLNRYMATECVRPLIDAAPSTKSSFSLLLVESSDTLVCIPVDGSTVAYLPIIRLS